MISSNASSCQHGVSETSAFCATKPNLSDLNFDPEPPHDSHVKLCVSRSTLIVLSIAGAIALLLLGFGLGYGLTRYREAHEGDDDEGGRRPAAGPAAVTAISEQCAIIGR